MTRFTTAVSRSAPVRTLCGGSCPLTDARGQSFPGRRAKEVCVAGPGDLLMRKRKHLTNKTAEAGLVFPDPSPIPLSA